MLEMKYIPFVYIRSHSLSWYDFQKPEESSLYPSHMKYPNDIGFCSISDIKKIKDPMDRIMFCCPAICRQHDPTKYQGSQFSFGIYYNVNHLLFMEDVIDWSHHRTSMKYSQVRTAYDLRFIKDIA